MLAAIRTVENPEMKWDIRSLVNWHCSCRSQIHWRVGSICNKDTFRKQPRKTVTGILYCSSTCHLVFHVPYPKVG
jgi:hypothetical protein